MKSQNHVEMSKELTEKHKCDEINETYNYKVGMGRTRQIYENVKKTSAPSKSMNQIA